MATDYDKLYCETPNALGEPNTAIVKFFEEFGLPSARVLDVGCGQGRDALFIARLGHKVVGVDASPNGIRDLTITANRERLTLEGVVADITAYNPEGNFDVVLFDRTLHMLPTEQRLNALEKLLSHVEKKGWILIVDEASNISGFEGVFSSDRSNWTTQFSKRGYLFVQRT